MNCKQGDLAIIVKSYADNEGKIVRCEEFLGNRLFGAPDGTAELIIAWRTSPELPDWGGDLGDVIGDDQLKPIRDPGDDAVDETLLWLPSPTKDTVND